MANVNSCPLLLNTTSMSIETMSAHVYDHFVRADENMLSVIDEMYESGIVCSHVTIIDKTYLICDFLEYGEIYIFKGIENCVETNNHFTFSITLFSDNMSLLTKYYTIQVTNE